MLFRINTITFIEVKHICQKTKSAARNASFFSYCQEIAKCQIYEV